MVVMRKKKVRKQRGSRTHGWGSPKKHRGAGSRGGRGKAGSGKKGQQRMTKLIKEGYKMGKRGFKLPKEARKEYEGVNLLYLLENLQNMYQKGRVGIEEDKKNKVISIMLTGKINKLLGGGNVSRIKEILSKEYKTQKIKIKTLKATSKAKEKCNDLGIELEELELGGKEEQGKTEVEKE